MKLTVLGMNGPYPAAGGATSGYLLQYEDTVIQIDLGTGVLARLTEMVPPENLTALVFSHWHADHCSDALPLLYRLQKYGKKLDVYGPMDEHAPVRKALEADAMINLHTIAPGDVLQIGSLQMTVGQARHPVPAVLLRFQNAEKTLVYTGDTNLVDGLSDFVNGADLLLADGLATRQMWHDQFPHLSAALCAELAKQGKVGHLMITHMNPDVDAKTVLNEAREIRPETELAFPGLSWEA